jgi:hypothetical protein
MAFPKNIKELCTPSLIYFVISMLGLAVSVMQNIGNTKSYTLGSFSCNVSSTILVFIVKLIYILFWTWILNLICRDGYSTISWFLVLFPFVLSFVLLGILLLS